MWAGQDPPALLPTKPQVSHLENGYVDSIVQHSHSPHRYKTITCFFVLHISYFNDSEHLIITDEPLIHSLFKVAYGCFCLFFYCVHLLFLLELHEYYCTFLIMYSQHLEMFSDRLPFSVSLSMMMC